MSSGRASKGLSGEIGDETKISVREGEGPVWIVLALFLPNPGDVLAGSKRVNDFAVCEADGRALELPEEPLLDMSRV